MNYPISVERRFMLEFSFGSPLNRVGGKIEGKFIFKLTCDFNFKQRLPGVKPCTESLGRFQGVFCGISD